MSRHACPRCRIRHHPKCGTIDARWPLQPLLDAYTGTNFTSRISTGSQGVATARTEGLTDVQADHWAIRCGLHPSEVWDDWADPALTVLDRQFLAEGWRAAWEHDQRPDQTEAAA